MYRFLLISSEESANKADIFEQIAYLDKFDISVTLMLDPSELDLIQILDCNSFDCAYVHIRPRISPDAKRYDPVKVLEYHGVPLVGNHYITQMMISDKCLTSANSGMGLPGVIVTREMWHTNQVPMDNIIKIGLPVIIKPNSFHASQGISQDSIISSPEKLTKQITYLFNRFQNLGEVLVEKFLDSATEYTVSVLGNNNSLACSVTKFKYKPTCEYHIYDEHDKTAALADRRFSFEIEPNQFIRNRLESYAKTLFRHFGMKDFGRFDFMVEDTYYLLEANCCPIPGNSFSWEWQTKYHLLKRQVLALFLSAFHFSQVSSGRADSLPFSFTR